MSSQKTQKHSSVWCVWNRVYTFHLVWKYFWMVSTFWDVFCTVLGKHNVDVSSEIFYSWFWQSDDLVLFLQPVVNKYKKKCSCCVVLTVAIHLWSPGRSDFPSWYFKTAKIVRVWFALFVWSQNVKLYILILDGLTLQPKQAKLALICLNQKRAASASHMKMCWERIRVRQFCVKHFYWSV